MSDLAVIGCGRWGINHVRVLHELGVLRVVCDTDPIALAKVTERFPGVETTTDIDSVLARTEVSALVIATKAVTHAALARKSLLAGKDLLVEKPLALKVSDAEELVRLADERGRILMVGHLLHYHPAILTMLEMMQGGALGRIIKIFSARMNWGQFRQDENVLWSFAPHDLSLFRRFAGSDPTEVFCDGEDSHLTAPGVTDTTLTLMRFPGGIRGEIKVSWVHETKEHRIVIKGSEASLIFADSDPKDKLKLVRRRVNWINGTTPQADPVPQITVIPFDTGEPLRRELEHFLGCVETRTPPLTDGREGLAVLRLLEASQQSLDHGGVWAIVGTTRRFWAHETASVHPDAVVGAGTKIWQHCQVLKGAVVGNRCTIGHNCAVFQNAVLGDGVKLESNIDVWPLVTLEDDVFVGPSAVFTNDLTPRAALPKGGKWVATRVKRGASIGANATIVCGVTIGEHAAIGAGSVVTHDVPAHALVAGNSARFIRWICGCNQWGRVTFPPVDPKAETMAFTPGICESCGAVYRNTPSGLQQVENDPTPVAQT